MYILQIKEDMREREMDVDYAIYKELLMHSHQPHIERSYKSLFNNGKLKTREDFPKDFYNVIPLGTIDFVTAILNIFYGIEKMNPIEIPMCLRNEHFLKRKYSIVYGKDLPKTGNYFVKNVSTLKTFSYSGRIDWICNEPDFLTNKKPFEDDELYQVSELVPIQSEYRVYIIDGKIYAIAYYNGDACVFPDVQLIQQANLMYSMQKDYPKSYTMDIMINNRGTSIIEIHPLFSCGIYQTVLGADFLSGYRDSLEYLKKYNTKLEPFECKW